MWRNKLLIIKWCWVISKINGVMHAWLSDKRKCNFSYDVLKTSKIVEV